MINELPPELGETRKFVQFSNGEPFMYLPKIFEILDLFKGINNYIPLMITNGTLLTEEIINELNSRDVRIAISNDGPNNRNTRGYDLFEDYPHVLKLIPKIKNFAGFGIVMNAQNYDFVSITNYFKQHFGNSRFARYHIKRVLNINNEISDKSLIYNPDEVKKKLDELITRIMLHYKSGTLLSCPELFMFQSLFRMHDFAVNNPQLQYYPLSHSYKQCITLNLSGDVYFKHSYPIKIGTVNDSLEDIRLSYLNTYKETTSPGKCDGCSAYYACKGGYPQEEKTDEYCEVTRLYISSILQLLEEMEVSY